MTSPLLKYFRLFSITFLFVTPSWSQQPVIRGEAGTYIESYGITGRDARRPDFTARGFFRPTLTFHGLTLGAQVWYSTEDERSRQSLNRYSLDPSWKWGSAHAGDFVPSLTRFTLNGTQIRGAQVSVHYPLFRFSVVGGLSQRETRSSQAIKSFDRQLWGLQIGFGKQGRTYMDLTFVHSEDRPKNNGMELSDSSGISASRHEAPQENMVGALTLGLSLFKNRVSVKSELAGSLFSENTQSATPTIDVPDFLRRLFKVRFSSRWDYAWFTESRFNFHPLQFNFGYQYIGPGFNSHGLPTLMNDRQALILGGTLNLAKNKIILRANTQLAEDNLAQQKRFATQRDRYTFSLDARPNDKLSGACSIGFNTMDNDADSDTFRVKYQAVALQLRLSYQIKIWQRPSTLSVNFGQQTSQDDNPLRTGSEQQTRNIRCSVNTQVTTSISVTPHIAYSITEAPLRSTYHVGAYGIGVGYNKTKFRNSAMVNVNVSEAALSIVMTGSSGYQLTRADQFGLNVRWSSMNGKSSLMPDYRERLVNMTYRHHF